MIRNKPSQQLCDDEKLIAVLRDGDQAAQHQEVVEHVEQCLRCQQRLDELAAGPQDWTKARQALLNDDPCSENAVGSDKWDYSLRNEGPVAWTESMASQLLSPASHPELLGRIGRYDVERLIGSGGMGVVFKAHDSELNRPVAIKILAPYLSSSGPARKRFAREARAAAAVVHEHVVPIYNVETERETPFLVMHYIAGESLQGRIDREGALELCEILRIGMQVASGLSAAHQQGLVHRDIKPSNILMEQGVERALITDFGLARAADDASMTSTGFHPGTPQYMSPEQAAGEQVDSRSDLFSLGSVLYTICTGRPPFRAETSFGVLRRITDVEPRPIREINPNIPEWLCLLICRLMSKSLDARFANAQEVADLLEQCLAHVQQPTSVPLPASLVAHADGRRSIFDSTRKGMVAMLGTIGMTLLGLVLLQATEAPDISGQWTSDEWGTVVLEANGSGEYEGAFTGSSRDKPAYNIVDIPVVTEGGFSTAPVLERVKLGTVRLKWSRVERRFNGTWRKGVDRSGKMSLRLMDNEIRGAWTTDKVAQRESGTPRLADLLWKRSVVTVPDGGTVLLEGLNRTNEGAKSPSGLAEMKERRDVLLQRVALLEKQLAVGETDPATVLTARDQLFQAELQLVTTKEERIESTDGLLKKFLEGNPKSIVVPSMGGTSTLPVVTTADDADRVFRNAIKAITENYSRVPNLTVEIEELSISPSVEKRETKTSVTDEISISATSAPVFVSRSIVKLNGADLTCDRSERVGDEWRLSSTISRLGDLWTFRSHGTNKKRTKATNELGSYLPIDPREFGGLDQRHGLLEQMLRSKALSLSKQGDITTFEAEIKGPPDYGYDPKQRFTYALDVSRNYLPISVIRHFDDGSLNTLTEFTYQEVQPGKAWFMKSISTKYFLQEVAAKDAQSKGWHQLLLHNVVEPIQIEPTK